MHDHCYVDPPPPKKRRKLRRAKIKKKATEAEEEDCSLQMEVIREHNNNNQSDEIKMDSVDVVNTLIDIILDKVSRNKVGHMVEYLCPFANVNSAFFHSVPLLLNCFH